MFAWPGPDPPALTRTAHASTLWGALTQRRLDANRIAWCLAIVLLGAEKLEAQDHAARAADLDRRLADAQTRAEELQQTIAALAAELRVLRSAADPSPGPAPGAPPEPVETPHEGLAAFQDQIVRADLAEDERGHEIAFAPELFVQSRFQTLPLQGASVDDAPTNFELTRMETRWSGRLSPKVGLGFELQYHPAPDGASFEIVNDAFVEYYASDRVTVRVGQFVKPFGFDIQHSSSDRESPERGIFAGYFFPGQRDRGAMVRADLPNGVQVFLGAFNGNRFFTDRDRRLNYNARIRKIFSRIPFAAGISTQIGRQLLPEGVTGNNHESLVGADAQWVWRRLGVRAEFVTGNRPSTLLDLEPDFAPAFTPGAKSTGGAIFSAYNLTSLDQVYGRFDRFNGDPVYGYDAQAVNVGYLRRVGQYSRVGIDYQWKNRITANDDSLNSRLQVIWNVEK